jgi:RNA polymerase sigma-70 factor, ECF subfamily
VLSDDQHGVLSLRVLIGLSVAETAELLAKTPGAVKSSQVRGLARLGREISRSAVSPGSRPAIDEMP